MIIDSKAGKQYNNIILLICMLLYLPVLFAKTDLWDGTILSHLIKHGRNDIYYEWFSEAGLFLTSFFYLPLSIPVLRDFYPLTGQIVTLAFLYMSTLEVCRISQLLYSIDNKQKLWVGVFYLLLPVWSSYFSTIYLMHSATIYLALLSARLIMVDKNKIIAFIIAPVAFQQASLAPFLLAIMMLFLIESKGKYLKAVIIYMAWVIFSFFLLRFFFNTFGLYQSYNKINFEDVFNFKAWKEYLLVLLLLGGGVIFPCLLKFRVFLSFSFLGLIFSLIACIVPYIAVAKYPSSMGILLMHSNSMRFIFPCAPVIAFIFSFALSKKTIASWFSPFLIIYLFCLFFMAQSAKIKDIAYQRAFIAAMNEHQDFNGKTLYFTGSGGLAVYEYTDILDKSFGKNESFPIINGRNYYTDKVMKNEKYRVKYMIPEAMPAEKINIKVVSTINDINLMELYVKFMLGNDFKDKIKLYIN